jgi:hypothetical protein
VEDAERLEAVTATANPFEYAARVFAAEHRWMHDPVRWVEECVDFGPGGGLTPYARDILAAIPARRRVAVRAPHGAGKTATVAQAVLWFACTREAAGVDWKVITTASAWRQLTLYLWPEIHKWVQRIRWDVAGLPAFDGRRQLLDLHLKLRHGVAAAVASDQPASIEGAHADSLLYVFDESKSIPAATWDAAEGAFSGGRSSGLPEAFALAVSTPGAPQGRFYDIHRRGPGLEDWWTRHITLGEAVGAGRIDQGWADQRALLWGADSAMFANRVLGEFHAGAEDAVIPLAWLEDAVSRWLVWDEAGRPDGGGVWVVGVDVARGGGDQTVFAHRRGSVVERLEVWSAEDTMRTTARVQGVLGGGAHTAVVDSIGVGAGVVDRLRELGEPVVAYTGSARTSVRTRDRTHGFVNTRSAAWWRLRELLDPAFDPVVALPPGDDLLLADLSAPSWGEVTGVPPRIQVEPKEKLVARLGRSPDRGDAVVMSFWDRSSQPGSLVGVQVLSDTDLLGWRSR